MGHLSLVNPAVCEARRGTPRLEEGPRASYCSPCLGGGGKGRGGAHLARQWLSGPLPPRHTCTGVGLTTGGKRLQAVGLLAPLGRASLLPAGLDFPYLDPWRPCGHGRGEEEKGACSQRCLSVLFLVTNGSHISPHANPLAVQCQGPGTSILPVATLI